MTPALKRHYPVGIYSGKRTTTRKVERIKNLLAEGETIERISKLTSCSRHLVYRIRELNASDIAQRKELVRASCARLAANGWDQLNQMVDEGRITNPMQLLSIAGCATDKLPILSPPDIQTIQHNHSIQAVNLVERIAQMFSATPVIQAEVIEQGSATRALQAPVATRKQEEKATNPQAGVTNKPDSPTPTQGSSNYYSKHITLTDQRPMSNDERKASQ